MNKVIYVNLENAAQKGAVGTHSRGILNGFIQLLGPDSILAITDRRITEDVENYVFDESVNSLFRRMKAFLFFKSTLSNVFKKKSITKRDKCILYMRFHFWLTPPVIFLLKRLVRQGYQFQIVIEYNDVIREQINYLTQRAGYSYFGAKIRKSWFYQALILNAERYSFHRADKIVCVTKGLVDYVKNIVSSAKTQCIKNAFDSKIARFSLPEKECLTLRSSFCSPDDFLIGHIGTLTMWDGLEELMKAISLCKHHAHIKLLIVGYGDMLGKLKKLVVSLKLEKNVHFIPPVDHAAALQYVYISDLVPLLKHNFSYGLSPIKYYEALGLGKYILASDIAHINEASAEGFGETMSLPIKIEALAARIDELYLKKESIGLMNADIRNYAEAQHTWLKRCDQILQGFSKN